MQRQSVCDDHVDAVLDIFNAAGMDETYGTYVDDACFDIHDYDDETDHETDDDTDHDTDDDTNDDTDDGGRGDLYPIKVQGSRTLSRHEWASWKSYGRDIKSNSSSHRDLEF